MRILSPFSLTVCLLLTVGSLPLLPAHAAGEAELADLLIKMIQAGRTVMAKHQVEINNPDLVDKGFTPEIFEKEIAKQYLEIAKYDLAQPPKTPQDKLVHALLQAGKEVVSDHQPAINRPGIAYKNFIPAVWARKTGEKFERATGVRLKLTSANYRYQGNKPDEFEAEVLKLFEDKDYPKGKGYSRTMMQDGKPVLRVIVPEYAGKACLSCHGEPKGQRDISGNGKEGWVEGSLAGAISLTMSVK
jgi:general secretion pathway protein A